MTPDGTAVREVLRSALTGAMRQRDREASSVYRTALAAIDNAEAVPVAEQRAGAIELSALGVGAAEVPRRMLDEATMHRIVRNEVVDLRAAATSMAKAAPEVAARLHRQGDLLDALLLACGRRTGP